MATPLEDRPIVLGKAAATLRRILPALLLLAFHFGIFTALGYLHPVVLVHLALIAAGVVALVTGSGLYFSTLVRRPTVAILLNLGLAILIWAVIPLVVSVAGSMIVFLFLIIAPGASAQPWFYMAPFTVYYSTHPLVQTGLVVSGAGDAANAGKALAELRYQWMDIKDARVVLITGIVLALAAIHTLLGWLFLNRAAARLRKRIF
jgi:ABC-type transport system involved in multi-copper enzyme maturation permease subunit